MSPWSHLISVMFVKVERALVRLDERRLALHKRRETFLKVNCVSV